MRTTTIVNTMVYHN